MAIVPFRYDSPQGVPVRGLLHQPEKPGPDALILTHGAGSSCQAPLLTLLAEAFCEEGFLVLRCDLPFRQRRPQGPPPRGAAEGDQLGLEAAVFAVRELGASTVILGGHSYGGRQASMLASSKPGLVDSLLLLSYPLHPPQRPLELRTAHFPALTVAGLFVHGERDGFSTSAELAAAIAQIPARTEVLTVAQAGHELLSRKNRDTLPREIVQATQRFTKIRK
jgi:uncharacterized protein